MTISRKALASIRAALHQIGAAIRDEVQRDKYVKHSYLYVDPKCQFRVGNSGFTRENTGVILEDHLNENGIPVSHKIISNNGNTGWIPAECLELL
jgi:hypothetical protein